MAKLGPDWDALQRGISGQVVLPGSAAYDEARPPFIAWFWDLEPRAVVRCATPEDVAEVIGFCRRHGINVATRGGGHSFAGHSATQGVVMEVTHTVISDLGRRGEAACWSAEAQADRTGGAR
jgi:FAD/FMN-containing dehydrogenase